MKTELLKSITEQIKTVAAKFGASVEIARIPRGKGFKQMRIMQGQTEIASLYERDGNEVAISYYISKGRMTACHCKVNPESIMLDVECALQDYANDNNN